ncbi:repressible alkaline phosphatase precursor [Akanthomyces lecanii RCEF 1005]|uniref:Repressible alkaline phosphatase n=1 Tax=Akanthomyces lecanii RCEF 1005 TaxID=1081108 RepID=A0A167UZS9_CORDF|nr:repressible alkaline phosphatase precursor [Akanthomyces lecanii RCEF 1005]
MSGAEVLGIISAVISIVDATSKVYHAAKDEAGLPPNFKTVAAKLPLITRLLDDTERFVIKEAGEGLTLALRPIVTDCNMKATQLQHLFEKVITAEGASRSERYVKAARTIGKGGRLLTTQIPQAVSRRGQENLSEAIEDVSKVKPSLPDGFEDESTYANYGSGVQNVNTGPGSLYSHQNYGPGN